MSERLPLSALLSQALVAFTIEFDNAFEQRTPHRTTNHGSTENARALPWLVSMAMWIHFLRFVPDDGITTRDFHDKIGFTPAGTKMWLTRLSKWWGYIRIDKSNGASQSNWLILPSARGEKAFQVWRPLASEIEERWKSRFGNTTVESLRAALQTLVHSLATNAPNYLPILGFDLLTASALPRSAKGVDECLSNTLPCLLSKPLYACATEFERITRYSFATCANVLRLADESPVAAADLPRLSGLSTEAVAMCIKRLEAQGLAYVRVPDSGKRKRTLILTEEGQRARRTYDEFVIEIERQWAKKFGEAVSALRRSSDAIVVGSGNGKSRLWEGLKAGPECWRASVGRPEILPHYPMVLHRGGFPDGS